MLLFSCRQNTKHRIKDSKNHLESSRYRHKKIIEPYLNKIETVDVLAYRTSEITILCAKKPPKVCIKLVTKFSNNMNFSIPLDVYSLNIFKVKRLCKGASFYQILNLLIAAHYSRNQYLIIPLFTRFNINVVFFWLN